MVLKTDGNSYATLLHHPFLFKGKPTQAQEVARRISGVVAGRSTSSQDLISQQLAISGAVAGEIYAQVKTYEVPITNSYPSHYIICHLPLVFLSPTSPLPFYSPSLSQSPPLFRLPVVYLVVMASSLSAPMSPEFEVLHFKQRQGENLKDACYRMMESYRKCTLEVNFRILLCNFYVGLNMTHRQLLDCTAKGKFIEIDPSIAHEIIEGIVGTLPQKGGSHPT